jgi:hypothetical protein
MKNKHAHRRSKGITVRRSEKEGGFEESIKILAKSQQLSDELLKMFSELGLENSKDDCSGNCITCKKKVGCETYNKIRDCFTG